MAALRERFAAESVRVRCSWKIAWERDESAFSAVAATVRFWLPTSST
jgi:hypothetical protein